MRDLNKISTLNKFNHKNTRFNSYISNMIHFYLTPRKSVMYIPIMSKNTFIITNYLKSNLNLVFYSKSHEAGKHDYFYINNHFFFKYGLNNVEM